VRGFSSPLRGRQGFGSGSVSVSVSIPTRRPSNWSHAAALRSIRDAAMRTMYPKRDLTHSRVSAPKIPGPGGATNRAAERRQNPSPWREPWGRVRAQRISSPGGAARTPTPHPAGIKMIGDHVLTAPPGLMNSFAPVGPTARAVGNGSGAPPGLGWRPLRGAGFGVGRRVGGGGGGMGDSLSPYCGDRVLVAPPGCGEKPGWQERAMGGRSGDRATSRSASSAGSVGSTCRVLE
jgi:hypothetical protein